MLRFWPTLALFHSQFIYQFLDAGQLNNKKYQVVRWQHLHLHGQLAQPVLYNHSLALEQYFLFLESSWIL